jgi:hypothetical protein
LSQPDAGPDFAHLTADDRRAIREILSDPGLPAYWRVESEPGTRYKKAVSD